MIVDDTLRFMFELSIALGVPIHEIKEWPYETINEYRAFNAIAPFTKEADHTLLGYMIALLRNQNVTKKSNMKNMTDLVPWLERKLPEYLEHELIIKARRLSAVARTEYAIFDLIGHIDETIQDELQKGDKKDSYLIHRLMEIKRDITPKKADEE